MEDTIGADMNFPTPAQPELTAKDIPTPIQNESFLADVRSERLSHSDDPQDRLFRAHGICLPINTLVVIFVVLLS